MKLLVVEFIGTSALCSECKDLVYSKSLKEHAKTHNCDDVIAGVGLQ